MNFFRTIVSKAPPSRRDRDEPVLESRSEPAPQVQLAPSPTGNGLTKAEEMLLFMAERRKRVKKIW